MALSNQVFTGASAPNLVGPGLQVVANRPNPYAAFSKGYDDQAKRELALQQYREAKLKADLAAQLFPDQVALQRAMLQARLGALNNPTNYGVPASPIVPIKTAPPMPAGNGNGGTTVAPTPPVNIPPNPLLQDPAAEYGSQFDTTNPFATPMGLPNTPVQGITVPDPQPTADYTINPFDELPA